MSSSSDPRLSRRQLLARSAGAGAALAAGTGAASATAQSEYGGWLSDVGNYDGETVDATGQEQVTITVGAEGNNGNFAFDPPAVHVDPGTTVRWEWTGQGGQHNVVAESGADFESELTANEGHTFEQTFDEDALVKYFCDPHLQLGMKGVVVVGDPPMATATPAGTPAATATPEGAGHGGGGGFPRSIALFGVAGLIAVLSPIAFAIGLSRFYEPGPE